jgi:hypothetical protein
MPFRKAKSIELHEAHLIITTSVEGYALTTPAARPAQTGRMAFRVTPAELDSLAARFGSTPTQPRPAGTSGTVDPGFALQRAYTEIPASEPGLTILNLECDVLGPQLVDIRIESRRPETPPEANDIEAITYSGAFTIWWTEDRPTSPEQLIAQAEAHPPITIESELPTLAGDGEESASLLEANGEDL